MSLYENSLELQQLHRHWLAAQARMLEDHRRARDFEARLLEGESMAPEEVVGGADLAARARDATEIWLQVDERLTEARRRRWESGVANQSGVRAG